MSLFTIIQEIKAHNDALQKNVNKLAVHFKGKKADAIRTELLPLLAKAYDVAVVDGSGKAKGTKVLDSSAEAYEACRKMLGRIVKAVCTKKARKPKKPESHARYSANARKFAKAFRKEFGSLSAAVAALRAIAK